MKMMKIQKKMCIQQKLKKAKEEMAYHKVLSQVASLV